jgi:hypothetical protein
MLMRLSQRSSWWSESVVTWRRGVRVNGSDVSKDHTTSILKGEPKQSAWLMTPLHKPGDLYLQHRQGIKFNSALPRVWFFLQATNPRWLTILRTPMGRKLHKIFNSSLINTKIWQEPNFQQTLIVMNISESVPDIWQCCSAEVMVHFMRIRRAASQ